MYTQKFKWAVSCLAVILCCYSNISSAKYFVFDPKDPSHTLYVPEGNGPFPAILLLHASTGVVKVNLDWAARLKDQGYIVYVIDSFTPRGWVDRFSVGWDKATAAQLSDTVPAYRYLSQLPNVDAKHIGILGFSMGGFDVLRIMEKPESTPEEFQRLPFKVAASFYGVCHRLSAQAKLRGSTTIFIGSEDDRATTVDCDQLVKRSNLINKSNSLVIYKNALHGFDNFEFPASKEMTDERGEHYHIGYNEEARQKSITDLSEYFGKYLKSSG